MHIVTVGNGMVGHHFVVALRKALPDARITVLGAEPYPAYDRVHLSDLFAGKGAGDLALATQAGYRDARIDLRLGTVGAAIDRDAPAIRTADGEVIGYDRLVLATGSIPFVPPVPGHDLPRCLVYRTVDDLRAIRAAAAGARRGVVIGGGLLGLECANALRNLGLETHVVEFATGLMGVQLDDAGSTMLQRKIEALGVVVHTATTTERIVPGGAGGTLALQFAGGRSLDTDLVVFSAGIRPADSLAVAAGLVTGTRGGIVVDEHCRSSDPAILAIGECALYDNRIFGLVAPGYRMAEAAVGHLAAQPAPFHGADMSTRLKLLGVEVGSIGDAHGRTAGALAYSYVDPRRQVYKRINVTADGTRLLGAVLVGDCSGYDGLLQYHLNGLALPAGPEALILPAVSGVATMPELPAAATVCSCHNIDKAAIIAAIDGGCGSVAQVRDQTRASTGCGGCATLLKSVVDTTLAARGVATSHALCPHFRHTRQELYQVCRVEAYRTFDELLASHGTGTGCEVCKPAVASILASLWNDHVLAAPLAGLQDTNDRHLANMQKNGTYSVVPRIAGGEITPERLIALATVARKYDLYTKITGGQRIDLFGAERHQLPAIWAELIAAGFETGHAYGKAVRTVKSCVGNTWCRYGVQDSVAMALRIEHRYKGLRAPHKLKFAVSGCTRECAEAQSKDIGVIATERGWNLFVAGNGGMRPRHADLFATDLDDGTLIRYIDRILMYYVATADRLQRTATWLDRLDGGLDALRRVVIDDHLGIAATLEGRMQHVVDTYQCEWRATLADPQRLRLFRPFINSDAQPPASAADYVRERGQRRPRRPGETVPPVRIPARAVS